MSIIHVWQRRSFCHLRLTSRCRNPAPGQDLIPLQRLHVFAHSRDPHPAIKLWCQVPFTKSKTVFQIKMYCMQCFLKSKYIKSGTFNDKNRWIIKKVMVLKKLLPHLATKGTYSPGDWRCDEAWHEQTLVYPPVMCQQRLIYCKWELNVMLYLWMLIWGSVISFVIWCVSLNICRQFHVPFEDFVLKFQHICRMMVDLGLVYWRWFGWEFLLHDLIYACLGWTGWSDWLRNGRLMPGSWDSPPILSDHILCNLIICTSSQLNLFGLSITLRTSRGCLWSLFKSVEHLMWQMISFTIHLAQVSV